MDILTNAELKILLYMIDGLSEKKPYKKIDNRPGIEPPLYVEKIGRNLFRVYLKPEDTEDDFEFHYFKLPDGNFTPVLLRRKNIESVHESTIIKDGEIVSHDPKEHEILSFSARWALSIMQRNQGFQSNEVGV